MGNNNSLVKIAVEPANSRQPALQEVVRACGAQVRPSSEASALIWVDPQCGEISQHLHAGIDWVQLPWAGIEPFSGVLDNARLWTCGKGIYARPVAEHVLALTLSCLHRLHHYAKECRWSAPAGNTLLNARVLILGGGGITEKLLPLLIACGADPVVLRRKNKPIAGARSINISALNEELPQADVVVLALALTEETKAIIGPQQLALMKSSAYLVNVARGAHIVTDDLVNALQNGELAGAALDVTDPEPLPEGHPLWAMDNCLITPHVGNTPEVGLALLKAHIESNVRLYMAGETPLGPVDVGAGY